TCRVRPSSSVFDWPPKSPTTEMGVGFIADATELLIFCETATCHPTGVWRAASVPSPPTVKTETAPETSFTGFTWADSDSGHKRLAPNTNMTRRFMSSNSIGAPADDAQE